MTRRFVVQQHTVAADDVHFDLMIEDGEVLVTFQLEGAPAGGTVGKRSFDHRRRYLDYEGPISGDRGTVAIWDRGDVVDVDGAPRDPVYRGRFAGTRLDGVFEIQDDGERVALTERAP